MMEKIPRWLMYVGIGVILLGALMMNVLTRPQAAPVLPVFIEDTREPAPDAAFIYIDLKGAVVMPGVYKVPAHMRLFQVIRMAGGLTTLADVSSINLSTQLFDQQTVTIPAISDTVSPPKVEPNIPDEMAKISLSHADAATLETLPGIGPSTAQRIIEDRLENGPFETIEAIMRVTGIGPAIYENIKPFVMP